MGDVVNLNQFRKRKEREQREVRATENRAKSGRGKIERKMTRNDAKRQQQDHDGKRIDNSPADDSA
jgi:hypothetical protein